MNAKDLLMDFLNYAFLIGVVVFFIVFFIVGDRFEIFTNILRSLTPIAVFSVFFLFFYKRKRRQKKKKTIDENGDLDEVLIYLKLKDKLKDLAIIATITVGNIILQLVFYEVATHDLIQIFIIFFIMILWNLYLLRANSQDDYIGLTFKKIIDDEVVIFLLPLIFYTLGYISGKIPELMDIFQALILMVAMYIWHYILFKKKDLTI